MMIAVRMKDGQIISGHSFHEIVRKMQEGGLLGIVPNRRYRKAVGRRVRYYNGMNIKVSHDEVFIRELRRIGEVEAILVMK